MPRGLKPALKVVGDASFEGKTAPKPPVWLPDEAKAEWRRVVPQLIERNVFSKADVSVLAGYCACYAQVRQCQEQLNAEGLVVPGAYRGGGLRPHPAVAIQHKAHALLRQYAAELGLTPVSRSRAALVDRRETNEFADFDI